MALSFYRVRSARDGEDRPTQDDLARESWSARGHAGTTLFLWRDPSGAICRWQIIVDEQVVDWVDGDVPRVALTNRAAARALGRDERGVRTVAGAAPATAQNRVRRLLVGAQLELEEGAMPLPGLG